jgi:hypothetical protein
VVAFREKRRSEIFTLKSCPNVPDNVTTVYVALVIVATLYQAVKPLACALTYRLSAPERGEAEPDVISE